MSIVSGPALSDGQNVYAADINNLVSQAGDGAAVFNNSQAAVDFTVKGSSDAGLLHVNGAGDGVNIGQVDTTNPAVGKLQIKTTDREGMYVTVDNAAKTCQVLWGESTTGTRTAVVQKILGDDTATSGDYDMIQAMQYDGSGPSGYSNVFKVSATGDVTYDGSSSSPAADFAEMFEWKDDNPDNEDRTGTTVVLDGGQIKPCPDGETPIGVISATAGFIGNNPLAWHGKFNADNLGRRTGAIDPYYNPETAGEADANYIPRTQRKEWATVGLLGRIRVKVGQPVAATWLKIRDLDLEVQEYLVK
tara:strand:- start:7075 stop:7986 length:912 start_codon:yes stop_codon:yes gene_type:complete